MTSEQRATLEEYSRALQQIADPDGGTIYEQQIAALAAALGTCGNCTHAALDDPEHGEVFCTLYGGFYNGKIMQNTTRCERWEASNGKE